LYIDKWDYSQLAFHVIFCFSIMHFHNILFCMSIL